MTEERQIVGMPANQLSTKRGFPVYRTNPSVPSVNGLPTRSKRINVPGGKAAVIVDNGTGEIKGFGGMGFTIAAGAARTATPSVAATTNM